MNGYIKYERLGDLQRMVFDDVFNEDDDNYLGFSICSQSSLQKHDIADIKKWDYYSKSLNVVIARFDGKNKELNKICNVNCSAIVCFGTELYLYVHDFAEFEELKNCNKVEVMPVYMGSNTNGSISEFIIAFYFD